MADTNSVVRHGLLFARVGTVSVFFMQANSCGRPGKQILCHYASAQGSSLFLARPSELGVVAGILFC